MTFAVLDLRATALSRQISNSSSSKVGDALVSNVQVVHHDCSELQLYLDSIQCFKESNLLCFPELDEDCDSL